MCAKSVVILMFIPDYRVLILEIIGTFGRADVLQRLIDQSLYQEILLLQKFNDILVKVLKP